MVETDRREVLTSCVVQVCNKKIWNCHNHTHIHVLLLIQEEMPQFPRNPSRWLSSYLLCNGRRLKKQNYKQCVNNVHVRIVHLFAMLFVSGGRGVKMNDIYLVINCMKQQYAIPHWISQLHHTPPHLHHASLHWAYHHSLLQIRSHCSIYNTCINKNNDNEKRQSKKQGLQHYDQQHGPNGMYERKCLQY